jgi:hypothetical protein
MAAISLNQTTASQGAGIDVSSIVDQIIFAEQAPEASGSSSRSPWPRKLRP